LRPCGVPKDISSISLETALNSDYAGVDLALDTEQEKVNRIEELLRKVSDVSED